MASDSAARNGCAAIRSRTRSATAAAPSDPVSGRISENSSPPNRATTSVSRAEPRMTLRRLDQRPAAGEMAMHVVDRLEPVEIHEQQRQRPAAARRALDLAPQRLIQIPRVVQLRQVVGDRQRLRASQRSAHCRAPPPRPPAPLRAIRPPRPPAGARPVPRRGRARPARRRCAPGTAAALPAPPRTHPEPGHRGADPR